MHFDSHSSVPLLWFSCGTAAELIKLYPVISRASAANHPWRLLFTGQSPKSCFAQWQDFNLPDSHWVELLHRDEDLHKGTQAASWFANALTRGTFTLRKHVETAQGSEIKPNQIWVVHGDTLSTLLGALYGAHLRLRVAHVEAGLRSGTFRQPFPEELTRTLVGQIARIHFPPEPSAARHLARERVRGEVIPTAGNTQIDAIEAALTLSPPTDLIQGRYGLVNIHRFETLIHDERKRHVKSTLLKAASKHRLIIVAHETTNAWVRSEPEFRNALENAGATWLPRQPFTKFAHWLARSEFVISDSGGNQEECAHLGTPCLLLRDVTERSIPEGRSNVVLSHFQSSLIDEFLRDPAQRRLPRMALLQSPADVIWRAMQNSN